MKKNLLVCLFMSLLFGCGKPIPNHVLKPKKMKEVLYDYHLVEAISRNDAYNTDYNREAIKNYVFKKNKISKADFDTSLVWYTKNPNELAKIYAEIGEQFRDKDQNIQNIIDSKLRRVKPSASGKSTDIWENAPLKWLSSSPLSNRLDFEFIADTSFKTRDRFLFSTDYIFLTPGEQKAYVGLSVKLENDSIMGVTREIGRDGHFSLSLASNSDMKIRSVKGFVYYKGDNKSLGLLLNNIKLSKLHSKSSDKKNSDSKAISNQSNTSINNDVVPNNVNNIKATTVTNNVDTSKVIQSTEKIEVKPDKGEEIRQKLRSRKKQ